MVSGYGRNPVSLRWRLAFAGTRPVAATNVGRASQPVASALTAWEGRPTTGAHGECV
jgi:hypothetical protein